MQTKGVQSEVPHADPVNDITGQDSLTEHEQTVNLNWTLLDESVGIEKPVIVAVLLETVDWRRKVAIASRARATLVWIVLKQPISSADLMSRLVTDRKGKLYTLWFAKGNYLKYLFFTSIFKKSCV